MPMATKLDKHRMCAVSRGLSGAAALRTGQCRLVSRPCISALPTQPRHIAQEAANISSRQLIDGACAPLITLL